jgi:uncharacterized OsmC-like protein
MVVIWGVAPVWWRLRARARCVGVQRHACSIRTSPELGPRIVTQIITAWEGFAVSLRELQQPIKEQYRSEPGAAWITLRASGATGDDAMSCSVDIGRALYAAEAHTGVGGSGTAACSGDLLLGALAACAQLTCQMVAANMGLANVHVAVTVEGDLDLRGTLGTPDVPVGFQAIRVRFALEGDVEPERLERLKERSERYCVVLQTLLSAPAIAAEWKVG